MSVMRCDKHDRHWDSDVVEHCPGCVLDLDEVRRLARRAVEECPRHNADTLMNVLDAWFPELTDDELNAAIRYGLDN